MSFLFASSHLPAVRSTRPELEEEEEENVNPESLPRSGGVRASSHLEERGPESARRAGGSPAPRRADAASEWLGRLKDLAEQQRTRSAPAAPDERTRSADAEPDHDIDEAPGHWHNISHYNRTDANRPPPAGALHLRSQGDSMSAKNRLRGYNRPVADNRNASPALLAAHAASSTQETSGPQQRGRPESRASHEPLRQQQIPSNTPRRAAYAEDIKQGKAPPRPGRLVFDEVGPSWFGNPANLSAQAGAMGLEYAKQANPTLEQIRKRSQTLGQGDIYVYSGHGGHINGEPHLAAHGEADESKGEVPVQYPRVGLTGGYKQTGTGFPVSQLKDDIAQGKNGVPMMAFISGCEVGAKDLSGLNDAGVSVAISAGGKAGERDAPRQMKVFMDVLTKGGTINDALKAVNEIVEQDNRHKLDDEYRQEPFTAVFRDGINGDSTLEDLRRHNAQVNEARKVK